MNCEEKNVEEKEESDRRRGKREIIEACNNLEAGASPISEARSVSG